MKNCIVTVSTALLLCSLSAAQMLELKSAEFLNFQDPNITYEVNFHPTEQLVVEADTWYRHPSGDLVNGPLAAVIGPIGNDGLDDHQSVFVFSINSSGNLNLVYSRDLTVEDGRTLGCPQFIQLPYEGQDEWCLVVPNFASESKSGSLDIIRLETPGAPTACHNKLLTPPTPPGAGSLSNVYSISYIPFLSETSTPPYCISAEFKEGSLDGDAWSFFGLASFRNGQFEIAGADMRKLPLVFYGNSCGSNPTRPCESQEFSFSFCGAEDNYILSTAHNGGVVIWDPLNVSTFMRVHIISQTLTPQHGWEQTLNSGTSNGIAELGDTHRAAILEGAENVSFDGNFVDVRLLFFANNTMGFCVYDVSNPATPQFVWQWDGDTRMPSDQTGSWNWSGSISPFEDVAEPLTIPPVSVSTPGRIWGLDLVYNKSEGDIRLFAGDCTDGLLAFNLSTFFNPFNLLNGKQYRSFDGIYAEKYWPYAITPTEICGALDTRVLQFNGSSFLVTSWMLPETTKIALSVHQITGTNWDIMDTHSRNENSTSAPINAPVVSLNGFSPNPSSDSFSISIFGEATSTCYVTIYDLAGRVVRNFESNIQTGNNTLVWNCRDNSGATVPSGNYFLRVNDDSGNAMVEKMMVI